jgi:uncharacterized membrane protein
MKKLIITLFFLLVSTYGFGAAIATYFPQIQHIDYEEVNRRKEQENGFLTFGIYVVSIASIMSAGLLGIAKYEGNTIREHKYTHITMICLLLLFIGQLIDPFYREVVLFFTFWGWVLLDCKEGPVKYVPENED